MADAPMPDAPLARAGSSTPSSGRAIASRPADLVVGVGDLKVGRGGPTGARILTFALGSCVGVTVWDPVAQVGGMLHAMLPDSTLDPARAAQNPAAFVDTGLPALFRACYALGAEKARCVVRAAGGAFVGADAEQDHFQIGKRNIATLRRLLWKNGVLLTSSDLGGMQTWRTLVFDLATGEVRLKTQERERDL